MHACALRQNKMKENMSAEHDVEAHTDKNYTPRVTVIFAHNFLKRTIRSFDRPTNSSA